MAENPAVYAFEPEHKLWFHSKKNAFGFVKDFKKATMSTSGEIISRIQNSKMKMNTEKLYFLSAKDAKKVASGDLSPIQSTSISSPSSVEQEQDNKEIEKIEKTQKVQPNPEEDYFVFARVYRNYLDTLISQKGQQLSELDSQKTDVFNYIESFSPPANICAQVYTKQRNVLIRRASLKGEIEKLKSMFDKLQNGKKMKATDFDFTKVFQDEVALASSKRYTPRTSLYLHLLSLYSDNTVDDETFLSSCSVKDELDLTSIQTDLQSIIQNLFDNEDENTSSEIEQLVNTKSVEMSILDLMLCDTYHYVLLHNPPAHTRAKIYYIQQDILKKKKYVLHIYNALSSLQKSVQTVFPSSSKSKKKNSELYQSLLNLYS